jgi:hypothetical protein
MIMPEPQMQAYIGFHKEQQIAHAPADPIEKQMVQTIIDTQWRLNCARAWELFADNHDKFGHMVDADRPATQRRSVRIAGQKNVNVWSRTTSGHRLPLPCRQRAGRDPEHRHLESQPSNGE